ncbi:hypothetical protein DFH08DRAFT_810078 [Mycena albidolilacea]|uniref:Uncharacterized protein n=1 Tax=Mycena albidolilacea TaxID=1033008 RepID=A0AAD7ER17_9AGAR|nr:hypothetical protein DFH08DRAFT_810078 [Mycena albidolilacea]
MICPTLHRDNSLIFVPTAAIPVKLMLKGDGNIEEKRKPVKRPKTTSQTEKIIIKLEGADREAKRRRKRDRDIDQEKKLVKPAKSSKETKEVGVTDGGGEGGALDETPSQPCCQVICSTSPLWYI